MTGESRKKKTWLVGYPPNDDSVTFFFSPFSSVSLEMAKQAFCPGSTTRVRNKFPTIERAEDRWIGYLATGTAICLREARSGRVGQGPRGKRQSGAVRPETIGHLGRRTRRRVRYVHSFRAGWLSGVAETRRAARVKNARAPVWRYGCLCGKQTSVYPRRIRNNDGQRRDTLTSESTRI